LAGIILHNGLTLEYLNGSIYGYNDGLGTCIKEVLHAIQTFEVPENLFNDIKEVKIRAY
jgi:hypothetical protein